MSGGAIGGEDRIYPVPWFLLPFYYIIKGLFFSNPRRHLRSKKRPFLSHRMRAKAHKKFIKKISRFRTEHHGRVPKKSELFGLAVGASHTAVKRGGRRGHWVRQKIRKVLLEENGIPYRMR